MKKICQNCEYFTPDAKAPKKGWCGLLLPDADTDPDTLVTKEGYYLPRCRARVKRENPCTTQVTHLETVRGYTFFGESRPAFRSRSFLRLLGLAR